MKERGLATVVTDPYDPSLGLAKLNLKADLVTVSHDAAGHNYLKGVKGPRLQIDGPGEYEVGGVFITGIPMAAKTNGAETKGKNGKRAKHTLRLRFRRADGGSFRRSGLCSLPIPD